MKPGLTAKLLRGPHWAAIAAFCIGYSVLANLLNLPLLILMFTAAYLARLYLLARSDRAGPLEAILPYRQASASTALRPS